MGANKKKPPVAGPMAITFAQQSILTDSADQLQSLVGNHQKSIAKTALYQKGHGPTGPIRQPSIKFHHGGNHQTINHQNPIPPTESGPPSR